MKEAGKLIFFVKFGKSNARKKIREISGERRNENADPRSETWAGRDLASAASKREILRNWEAT